MSANREFPGLCGASADRQARPLDLSQITVMFTDLASTFAAVGVAQELGRALGGEVTVMALQSPLTQPRGDELTPPDGESDMLRLKLRAERADVRFRVVVSSKTSEALRLMLPRRSLVVIGGRPRWWPTSASRLRRLLEGQGHCVLFVPEVAHAV